MLDAWYRSLVLEIFLGSSVAPAYLFADLSDLDLYAEKAMQMLFNETNFLSALGGWWPVDVTLTEMSSGVNYPPEQAAASIKPIQLLAETPVPWTGFAELNCHTPSGSWRVLGQPGFFDEFDFLFTDIRPSESNRARLGRLVFTRHLDDRNHPDPSPRPRTYPILWQIVYNCWLAMAHLRLGAIPAWPANPTDIKTVGEEGPFAFVGAMAVVRNWIEERKLKPSGQSPPQNKHATERNTDQALRPEWDVAHRTLSFDGKKIRDYSKRRAPKQEAILNAFQEVGWPDALQGVKGITSTDLNKTINRMNRELNPKLIAFRQTGDGRSVAWTPVSVETVADDKDT